jgi:hypothetical protein
MRNRLLGLCALLSIVGGSVSGQIAIAPASDYTLTQDPATDGTSGHNNAFSFDLASAHSLSAKTIKAQASGGLSIGTGVAHSQISYDFRVPATTGTSGNTVGAWVSYSTQWQGFQLILASLGTNASVVVDMVIRDTTEGRNLHLEPIHELDLKTYSYKIITAGVDLNDSGSKANTFPAVLIRGHTYRITLRLSATLMVISPTGLPSTCDYMDGLTGGGTGRVQLNTLFVKVGLDEKEILQKVNGLFNHRHIYLTGRGVGHNNVEAASSLPIPETRSAVETSAPLIVVDEPTRSSRPR